jgi:hypothetical protein
MVELLSVNDAELQAIILKGDGHRGRDADRYAFIEYTQSVKPWALGS